MHLQRKYCNNYLKHRAHDSAERVEEYESQMRRIEQLLELTDPEELLKEDQFLVEDYSLEELAATTSNKRITWEESLNAAKSAAGHARVRRNLDEHECSNYDELQMSFFNPRPGRGGRGGRRSPQSSDLDWTDLDWLRPQGGGGRGGRRRRTQRNDPEATLF